MNTQQITEEFQNFESMLLSVVLKDKSQAEAMLLTACKTYSRSLNALSDSETYEVKAIPDLLLRYIIKFAQKPDDLIRSWKELPYNRSEFQWRRLNIDFLLEMEFYRGEHIRNPWLWAHASHAGAATELGNENYDFVVAEIDVDSILPEHTSVFSLFFDNYSKSKATNRTRLVADYKKFFVPSGNTPVYSMRDASRKEAWESMVSENNGNHWPIQDRRGRATMRLVREAFGQYIRDLLRKAEDQWRAKNSLPAVGEGWKSETELYFRVKKRLPNQDVIMHGKPKWLGRQHFDIWIPALKVAIEYQGRQHDEPIDFFGGEAAFEKNRQRDARKKSLCKRHGVNLIEVRPGYDLEEVITRIGGDNH